MFCVCECEKIEFTHTQNPRFLGHFHRVSPTIFLGAFSVWFGGMADDQEPQAAGKGWWRQWGGWSFWAVAKKNSASLLRIYKGCNHGIMVIWVWNMRIVYIYIKYNIYVYIYIWWMSVCDFFWGLLLPRNNIGDHSLCIFRPWESPWTNLSTAVSGQEDILPDEVQRPCLMHVFF